MIAKRSVSFTLAVAAAASLAVGCAPSKPKGARQARSGASDIAVAAEKTYVPPGDLDEFYMFSSGGHSGQVFVFGIPSMRHITTIPVFHAVPGDRLRLRRRHEEDAGRVHLG